MDEDLKPKAVIEVKKEWPWWKKWLASMVNYSAVVVWVVVTYVLMTFLSTNPDLSWNSALYLAVVVPATTYGLITLIAGLIVLTWLNPFMRPSKYQDGSDTDKYCITAYWIGGMLSLALIIFGCN